MTFVNIIEGFYRGDKVSGIYPLLSEWKEGANGGFIRLRGDVGLKRRGEIMYNPRINVEPNMYFYCTSEGVKIETQNMPHIPHGPKAYSAVNYELEFAHRETDDEAIARIRHTFDMLSKVADSVAQGNIRGLVISGPPGIGKSHDIEEQLKLYSNVSILSGNGPSYEIISGSSGGIGLYKKLYTNRQKGFVTVFDDSDGILADEDCLSLLKAALNSGERRRLSWNFESRVLANEEIPNTFDFEGSVIFITNVDFENSRAGRIGEHLKAIMSRCHYMDLELSTMRDKLLRIKQIVDDGILFKNYNFTTAEENMVVQWVFDNAGYLREVSLRMVKKVADLYLTDKHAWKEYAESTCLKREAKYKRLLAQKQKVEMEE